jgi:hypothetical protein
LDFEREKIAARKEEDLFKMVEEWLIKTAIPGPSLLCLTYKPGFQSG